MVHPKRHVQGMESDKVHFYGFVVNVRTYSAFLWYVVPEVFHPAHPTTGPTSSSIIEEIKGLCDMGLALMAYFYCDFRDPQKQDASG